MFGEWVILALSGGGALVIAWVAAELGRDC